MAAHRYWRLVGFAVAGAGDMEVRQIQLLDSAGVLSGGTLSSSHAPVVGDLPSLVDGTAPSVRFEGAAVRSPGFWLRWDFGGVPVEVVSAQIRASQSEAGFPALFTIEYADTVAGPWSGGLSFGRFQYPGEGSTAGAPDEGISQAPVFVQNLPLPIGISGSALPNGAASSHLREYAFFDAYHGGLGIIYGTVKEKQTPANAPLRRKVWLMDERSGLVIRETWSDAATGGYEFRGIKQGVPYTVLAYDHAHNYRAFAGDNLLPDPLP